MERSDDGSSGDDRALHSPGPTGRGEGMSGRSDDRLPAHIAVVMDGNGRWARSRMLPRGAGHRAGVQAARALVEGCARRGISVLTLFAFSSENWRRPPAEVGALMGLFQRTLRDQARTLHRNGIRLRFIGDRSRFPEGLRRRILEVERMTAGNAGLQLNIAADYGGRWDILSAARSLAREVAAGRLAPEDIDQDRFARAVSLGDLPEPDLFVRTGGEQRVSNFLLWHLAYAELYFTETLWPDFDDDALQEALTVYARRQRRFGRTGDQVEQRESA